MAHPPPSGVATSAGMMVAMLPVTHGRDDANDEHRQRHALGPGGSSGPRPEAGEEAPRERAAKKSYG